jgi:signal peptidase II
MTNKGVGVRLEMKRKYWVLIVVCLLVLFLDQWTKLTIRQSLSLYQTVEVIHGFFNLVHVRNTGGAFGIFGGERGGVGSLFFVVVSVVAIGSIIILLIRLKEDEKIISLSLSFILSGAVGNLIDRLWHGEVVDFLDFYVSSYHWPAFNTADSAICVGIGLMVLALFVKDHKKKIADSR